MVKKMEERLIRYMNQGLIDERKLCAVGNAKRLPGGEFGFVLMCLKGHHLDFYDTDIRDDIGQLLYSVDLRQVTDLKTSTFIFNSFIQFTYQGFRYKIVDAMAKDLYNAIKEEVTNK